MSKFTDEFMDRFMCGTALLAVETHERNRCIEEIHTEIKKFNEERTDDEKIQILIWTVANGWKFIDGPPLEGTEGEAHVALNHIRMFAQNTSNANGIAGGVSENAIFIMQDFGFYLHKDNYQYHDVVISSLYGLIPELQASTRSIVFVGPNFKTPSALSHEIKTLEYALPNEKSIQATIEELVGEHNGEIEKETLQPLVLAAKGLVQHEVEDATALCIKRFGLKLDNRAITQMWEQKIQIIKNTDLLQFAQPIEGGLDNIGGLQNIKNHLKLDQQCLQPEAKSFGINPPKGLLIAGIPGSGKSLTAKCAASFFKLPLISLEIGQLMSKYVGESEDHAIQATKLLDSLAPAVLWIDEVEKAFGGVGSDLDSGATQRVFGIFLKWMNERESLIYTIMTANDVSKLPVEFLRKGRIDEVYFVDLPNSQEREDIIRIQLRKCGRDDTMFDCLELSKHTVDFSGADIEAVIQLALKKAFLAKMKDIEMGILIDSIGDIMPIYKTDKKRIDSIRKWGNEFAKPANVTKVVKKVKNRNINVSMN